MQGVPLCIFYHVLYDTQLFLMSKHTLTVVYYIYRMRDNILSVF